jgi:hypothetical protein
LVALTDDPSSVHAMRGRALETYRRHFARALVNDRWAAVLNDVVGRGAA